MRSRWRGPYVKDFICSRSFSQKNFIRVRNSKLVIVPVLKDKRISVYNGRRFESFMVKAAWPLHEFRLSNFTEFKRLGSIHIKKERVQSQTKKASKKIPSKKGK